MNFKVKRRRFPAANRLGDISRIEKGGQPIADIDELSIYVEPPLLEPMKVLYKKGIRTIMSSANVEGGVYFMIVKDSLTQTNLDKALEMGYEEDILHGSEDMEVLYIAYEEDIDESTDPKVIEAWGMGMVQPFESQQNFTITRHQKPSRA